MKPRRKFIRPQPVFRFVLFNGLASVQRLIRGQYMHLYTTGPEQAERNVQELISNPNSPLHDLYILIDM